VWNGGIKFSFHTHTHCRSSRPRAGARAGVKISSLLALIAYGTRYQVPGIACFIACLSHAALHALLHAALSHATLSHATLLHAALLHAFFACFIACCIACFIAWCGSHAHAVHPWCCCITCPLHCTGWFFLFFSFLFFSICWLFVFCFLFCLTSWLFFVFVQTAANWMLDASQTDFCFSSFCSLHSLLFYVAACCDTRSTRRCHQDTSMVRARARVVKTGGGGGKARAVKNRRRRRHRQPRCKHTGWLLFFSLAAAVACGIIIVGKAEPPPGWKHQDASCGRNKVLFPLLTRLLLFLFCACTLAAA